MTDPDVFDPEAFDEDERELARMIHASQKGIGTVTFFGRTSADVPPGEGR